MGLDAYFRRVIKVKDEFGYFRKNWVLHDIVEQVWREATGKTDDIYDRDLELTEEMLREIRVRAKRVFTSAHDDKEANFYEWWQIRNVLDEALQHAEDGEPIFYKADW